MRIAWHVKKVLQELVAIKNNDLYCQNIAKLLNDLQFNATIFCNSYNQMNFDGRQLYLPDNPLFRLAIQQKNCRQTCMSH